jgi:hypothetical protein
MTFRSEAIDDREITPRSVATDCDGHPAEAIPLSNRHSCFVVARSSCCHPAIASTALSRLQPHRKWAPSQTPVSVVQTPQILPQTISIFGTKVRQTVFANTKRPTCSRTSPHRRSHHPEISPASIPSRSLSRHRSTGMAQAFGRPSRLVSRHHGLPDSSAFLSGGGDRTGHNFQMENRPARNGSQPTATEIGRACWRFSARVSVQPPFLIRSQGRLQAWGSSC